MAVKEGLPATDFSKMNRDYIRNVAEGETVKDGLPATDFSRMNREYIKAVVEESGGGGGSSVEVEALTVTENRTYTAPEGKAYSPVTVNVASDFSTAEVEFINISTTASYFVYVLPHLDSGVVVFTEIEVPPNDSITVSIPIGANGMIYNYADIDGLDEETTPTSTGSISIDFEEFTMTITGDGTFTAKGFSE